MSPSNEPPLVALGPDPAPEWLVEAIVDGGGQLVPLDEAGGADALVWASVDDVAGLRQVLASAPSVGWVQLPWAGVENFVDVVDDERVWTCGKGVYAEPVAELALALALAGLRRLDAYVGATSWSEQLGRNLLDARVTIVGGGGIAEALIDLLRPFRCHVTVVRPTVQHMDGVDVVVDADRLVDALPGADVVFLALALTPETDGLIGADELSLMEPHAWLVNVARGRHVVTDELVDALRAGVIGGAALEVTEPEPLPDGHPLWHLPNCIITPHTGTPPDMARPLLAARIRENVRRFATNSQLMGIVDPNAGY